MNALGMIEVYGYLPAVEALDAALKAANVTLVNVVLVKGGLVSVLVTGDVGATKAAIDAGAAAACRVGKVISVHVIPRPADAIEKMLGVDPVGLAPPPSGPASGPKAPPPGPEPDPEEPAGEEAGPWETWEEQPDHEPVGAVPTQEELAEMTVMNLRVLARTLGITAMTRREIRDAKKEELIAAITAFKRQER